MNKKQCPWRIIILTLWLVQHRILTFNNAQFVMMMCSKQGINPIYINKLPCMWVLMVSQLQCSISELGLYRFRLWATQLRHQVSWWVGTKMLRATQRNSRNRQVIHEKNMVFVVWYHLTNITNVFPKFVHFYSEGKGCMLLQHNSNHLPDCMLSMPKNQILKSLPLWKPQVSYRP